MLTCSAKVRGGKRTTTSGVQRSCEVMPTLPAPGGRLVKHSSRDSNDGSVSSNEGSKWVENKTHTKSGWNFVIKSALKTIKLQVIIIL